MVRAYIRSCWDNAILRKSRGDSWSGSEWSHEADIQTGRYTDKLWELSCNGEDYCSSQRHHGPLVIQWKPTVIARSIALCLTSMRIRSKLGYTDTLFKCWNFSFIRKDGQIILIHSRWLVRKCFGWLETEKSGRSWTFPLSIWRLRWWPWSRE